MEGWWEGMVAVEGIRKCGLAAWQVLLVTEPGNPCLEILSMHKAGPAFLQAVSHGPLWDGWVVASRQDIGPPPGPETADRFQQLSLTAKHPQTLQHLFSGVYGFPYPLMHAGTHLD